MGIKRFIAKQALKVKVNAPTILMVGGAVTVVAGGVLACKATLKLGEKAINPTKSELNDIHTVKEKFGIENHPDDPDAYTKKDYVTDLIKTYIKAGARVIKIYGVSVFITSAGFFMIFKGRKMLVTTITGLTAAIKDIEERFDAYRGRVREAVGEEAEERIANGMYADYVEADVVNDRGETEHTAVTQMKCKGDLTGLTYILDEQTCAAYDISMDFMRDLVANISAEVDRKMKVHGYIFLDKILDLFCINENHRPAFVREMGYFNDVNLKRGACPMISVKKVHKVDDPVVGRNYLQITISEYIPITEMVYLGRI